jgi:hypothetical protein
MMLAIEFGSRQRGDFNLSSDKDILLLASSWEQITIETREHTLAGFSVSAFLFDKAVYLIKSGNLFFKHICDEGVLVFGSQDQYQALISQWHPANNYSKEIDENIDLLEVLTFAPSTYSGIIVIVDILISSVRNILIRRLADQGCYVFSWSQVFKEAQERGMIKNEDIQVFLIARYLKNQYRQGIVPVIPQSYLEYILNGAQRAFNISFKLKFARRMEMRSLPEKYCDGSYKQLRALELMCAEYGFHKSLGSLLLLTSQPAYFCANGPIKAYQRSKALSQSN